MSELLRDRVPVWWNYEDRREHHLKKAAHTMLVLLVSRR